MFEHFVDINKTIKMPKGATKNIRDYKLTRYECYLIAQNGDTRKKVIALAQTYFVIQTRKQEITEYVKLLDYCNILIILYMISNDQYNELK